MWMLIALTVQYYLSKQTSKICASTLTHREFFDRNESHNLHVYTHHSIACAPQALENIIFNNEQSRITKQA